MKQYIFILALIFVTLLGMTEAANFKVQALQMSLMDASAEESSMLDQELLAQSFMRTRQTLSMDDFLKVSFDPVNNAVDKQLLANAVKDARFNAFRDTQAQMRFHMSSKEYDALFDKSYSSLIGLAESLDVSFENHKETYNSLLSRVESKISAQHAGHSSFVDASTQVSALRASSHLFAGRSTLHKALHEDAIMFSVSEHLEKALVWVEDTLKNKKCVWCKKLVDFAKGKACDAAAGALCTAVIGLASQAAAPIVTKFVCGFPINLAGWLSKLCKWALKKLQEKLKVDDECLCSLVNGKLPDITIPRVNFPLIHLRINPRTLTFGEICTPIRGQCAWHTEPEKKQYTIDKPKHDRERAAKKKAEEDAEKAEQDAKSAAQKGKEAAVSGLKTFLSTVGSSILEGVTSGDATKSVSGLAEKVVTSIFEKLQEKGEEIAQDQIDGAVEDAAVFALNKFKDQLFPKIKDVASHVKGKMREFASKIKAAVKEKATAIKANVSEAKANIKAKASEAKTAIKSKASETKADIKAAASKVSSSIKNVFSHKPSSFIEASAMSRKLELAQVMSRQAYAYNKMKDSLVAATKEYLQSEEFMNL